MRTYAVECNNIVRSLGAIHFEWSQLYGTEKMTAEMFGNLFYQWLDKEYNCNTYSVAEFIKLYSAIHYNTSKDCVTNFSYLNDRFTIEYVPDDQVVIKFNRVSRRYSYKQLK